MFHRGRCVVMCSAATGRNWLRHTNMSQWSARLPVTPLITSRVLCQSFPSHNTAHDSSVEFVALIRVNIYEPVGADANLLNRDFKNSKAAQSGLYWGQVWFPLDCLSNDELYARMSPDVSVQLPLSWLKEFSLCAENGANPVYFSQDNLSSSLGC